MISDFTLLLYVFMVGLELNPSHMFPKKRKYPLYIGFVSVFFPFIMGLGTSFILNDEDNINGNKRTITHMLYIGLVLSISVRSPPPFFSFIYIYIYKYNYYCCIIFNNLIIL